MWVEVRLAVGTKIVRKIERERKRRMDREPTPNQEQQVGSASDSSQDDEETGIVEAFL